MIQRLSKNDIIVWSDIFWKIEQELTEETEILAKAETEKARNSTRKQGGHEFRG